MTSPTERSKRFLEEDGYRVAVVEKWIPIPNHPAGGQRKDLFGFGDIIAKKRGVMGSLIVQTTSGSNVSSRVTKILTECADDARLCLETGDRIVVHGWRRLKKVIGRRHWIPVIREVTLADFDSEARDRRAAEARAAEEDAVAHVEGLSR